MKKAYMGIDPGASGACVVISEDNIIHEIRFSKSTDKEIWQFIENISFKYQIKCILEQVSAMPGQGVSSMFTFGSNVGLLRGFTIAASIPYEEKVPRTWQKALGIQPRYKPKKGESGVEESKTDFKKRLKQKAEQLYPNHKITTDTADAILIAHFCMIINK